MDVTVSCKFMQFHHENIFDLLPIEQASEGGQANSNASLLFQSLRIKETSAAT